ncbi:MAG: 2-oxoacid:acceptor oxidoreductase family protein [Candidatus Atabeyarchaeum deiterrae]
MEEKEITSIFVVGLGGQGTIMFSKILSTALLRSGFNLIVKETTGGTHRGSPVFSEIKFGSSGLAPGIGDGEADVAVGLEPLECLRYARKYSPSSVVLVSTHPIPPPLTISGKPYPPLKAILDGLKELTGKLIQFNATKIAVEDCGHQAVANMVMLGVFTGLRIIKGLKKERVMEAVQELTPEASRDMNIAAFEKGLQLSVRLDE